MDLRDQHHQLYQESLRLRTEGRGLESEALEARASALLNEARHFIEAHPKDPASASALLFLAERQWDLEGDSPHIQGMLERALSVREAAFGSPSPDVAEALAKLAEFHFLAARWTIAEPIYRRAVGLYDALGTYDPGLYSACQGGWAQCLTAMGDIVQADTHYEKAIQFCQDKRVHYFLLTYRAEGLEKQNRSQDADRLRAQALDLLPKANPGENGFQV